MRSGLNAVDLVLLLLVLLATIRGCMRGTRAVLVECVALLGGLFAALRLAPAVARELAGALPLPAAPTNILAFAATLGIVCAGLLLIGRLILAPRLRLPLPSLPGALAGLVAGLVAAALLAALLLSLPLPAPVTRLAVESRFGARIAAPALRMGAAIRPP